MKLGKLAGATSEIWQIFIQDSSSTTGAGLTGLTNLSSSLTAYYHRDTDTTATAISLVTMTVGTFTSSGFKEIDATNMPGWYQFCPPNAALAAGAKSCGFHLKGAANMAALPIEVQLVSYNPDDAVHLGLSALPNTAVTTNASLLTSGTGTDQLSVASGRIDAGKILGTAISTPATAGILDVNVKNMNNVAATSITTINANQGTTQPVNFTGTAGSALVKGDMVDVAGSAVSTSAAQLGVNVVNINAVSAASVTTVSANQGTTQPINFTGSGASALAKSDMVDIAGSAVSTSSAQIGVNAVNLGGTAQTGRDIGASVLLSSGTGTGQLDFTSGVVKANVAQILGTALTETAGQIAAAFKKLFDVAAPVFTATSVNQTGDSFARIGAAGAGLTALGDTRIAHLDADVTSRMATFSLPTNFAALGISVAGKITDVVLVDTLTTYTGDTPQTGDSYALVGTAGAGLTALGDTRIAHLDADVSTRAATGDAMTLTSGERDSVADALLDRDMSTGTDSGSPTVRTMRQALRFIRNKWSISGTTLTVTKEDDSTASWTSTLTATAGADPITGNDPAGP